MVQSCDLLLRGSFIFLRPSHWGSFVQHLRLLVARSTALRNSKHITPEAFLQLTSDTHRVLSRDCKTISQKEFHAVMSSGSLISSANQCHGASRSSLWLPIDLFLEDSMDGSQVAATSAIENLTGKSQLFCFDVVKLEGDGLVDLLRNVIEPDLILQVW